MLPAAALWLGVTLALGASTTGYDLAPLGPEAAPMVRAWEALSSGDAAARRQALRAVEEWGRGAGSDADAHARAIAIWLGARLAHAQGDPSRLEPAIGILGESSLADPLRLELAEHLRAKGKRAEASRRLLEVSPSSPLFPTALARAVAIGLDRQSWPRLQAVLERSMRGTDRLAVILAAARLQPAKEAARQRLLELWWADPDSELGVDAFAAIRRQLPRALHLSLRVAHIAFDARKHGAQSAGRELARLRPRSGQDRDALAFGRAVLASVDPAQRERALDKIDALRVRLGRGAFAPFFEFGRARVLERLDRPQDAIAALQALTRSHPEHFLAARAHLEAALLLHERGESERARALYVELADRAHRGPAAREAVWQAGFAAFRSGDPAAALRYLTRLGASYGAELEALGITWEERASYWRGRALIAMGRLEDGRLVLRDLRLRFPAGWYAILAADRLREVGAAATEDTDPTIPARPTLDLGIALVRLGADALALAELEHRWRAGELAGSSRWLLAELYRKQGQPAQAAGVLKQHGVPAVPPSRAPETFGPLYRLAYRAELEQAAQENRLPPALLAGVCHIESRFNPAARSGPGAIGLTQLMPTTAEEVGRLLGIPVSPARLTDPGVNLRLGGRLLAELLALFRDHPALALAGYNAGAGAAKAWWRDKKGLETDVFVELIPYAQARNFVRRVVAVAEIYGTLHGLPGVPLAIPKRLPEDLGPFFEARRTSPPTP
jgi:soluble lytic murein transglycosylase